MDQNPYQAPREQGPLRRFQSRRREPWTGRHSLIYCLLVIGILALIYWLA
jgi:hypothetical protein